jgi:HSP20 family protein
MLQTYIAPFGGADPFADMRRVQSEMNRVFNGLGLSRSATARPSVNFWAGQDSVVMTAELPGLSKDDIEVTVKDTIVSIRGSYPHDGAGENATWHLHERPGGSFSRSVELPFRVDPDLVEARFQNGILTVEMQRPEDDKPKRITIRTS